MWQLILMCMSRLICPIHYATTSKSLPSPVLSQLDILYYTNFRQLQIWKKLAVAWMAHEVSTLPQNAFYHLTVGVRASSAGGGQCAVKTTLKYLSGALSLHHPLCIHTLNSNHSIMARLLWRPIMMEQWLVTRCSQLTTAPTLWWDRCAVNQWY